VIVGLRRVSLRHFARHKLRVALTVFGIALGVATIVAMRILLEAVTASYGRAIERLAGRASLEVVNGEAGVPEQLLDELRRVPGVTGASPSVSGWLPLPALPGSFLFVFGVDLVSDGDVRDYETISQSERSGDPLAFLAQPDSIALTKTLLERTGLHLGDRLKLSTSAGPTDLTIRSILDVRAGPASLFNGNFALMDIFAAQNLFGLDRRFTQIDLRLADSTDLAAVEAAVSKVVAGRGSVERPPTRGHVVEKLFAGHRILFLHGALMSITVGLYLVFDTMMIAVAQRRREIAILRSVGMSRGEVVRLVFAESVALGILGCLVGVPLGLGLAIGLAPVMAQLFLRLYYLTFDWPAVRLETAPILWGAGLALLATVLAAALPAREAVRLSPVEALRPGRAHNAPAGSYRVSALIGFGLIVVAVGVWLAWDRLGLPTDPTASLVLLAQGVGLLFVAPAAVRLLVKRSERPLQALAGVTGALAGRNLDRNMRRVAISGAAFLVSLGGAISTATFATSTQETARWSLESWFSNHDLALFPYPPVPDSVAKEIAALPEVAGVGVSRGSKVAYEGDVVVLAARGLEPPDPEKHRRRLESMLLVDGDASAVVAALARGEGAVVNEAFTRRFAKRVGDVVRLSTPQGLIDLPILGSYFDMNFSNMGVVLVDLSLYQRVWGDHALHTLEPILKRGASLDRLEAEISERWATRYAMRVFRLDTFREQVRAEVTGSYVVAYVLMAIAFGIALIGVVNSLLAAVLDRIPEIGILRAVGATRRQIEWSVMLEAAVMGLVGAALAAAAGTVFGYLDLDIVMHRMLGVASFYRHPLGLVVSACVAGVVLAALAGWLPGRTAARLPPTEALRYE
jgi:putative ABC transport system permease protein